MTEQPADALDTLLSRVTDRASFFGFVHALVADRKAEVATERSEPSSPFGPGANGWENGTIKAYLEAALAWAQDWAERDAGVFPEAPSWRAFAAFLYAGKAYE